LKSIFKSQEDEWKPKIDQLTKDVQHLETQKQDILSKNKEFVDSLISGN
jgi:hypothetical protein